MACIIFRKLQTSVCMYNIAFVSAIENKVRFEFREPVSYSYDWLGQTHVSDLSLLYDTSVDAQQAYAQFTKHIRGHRNFIVE